MLDNIALWLMWAITVAVVFNLAERLIRVLSEIAACLRDLVVIADDEVRNRTVIIEGEPMDTVDLTVELR